MNKSSFFKYFSWVVVLSSLSACSVKKLIPEGKYLLDDVKITSDNKDVKGGDYSPYVRQNPNTKWFSLIHLPVHIYALAGEDSTKWMNRFWRRLGDKPVIYDSLQAERSRVEIQKAVRNVGYMQAVVGLDKEIKDNKIRIRYKIRTGEPYVVSHLNYDIPDYTIENYIMADSTRSLLKEGMRFDVNVLDEERSRITRLLQNNGYFRFNKDFLTYQADTVKNLCDVALTLRLKPYQRRKEDAPRRHEQYTIRKVNYLMDTDFSMLRSGKSSLSDSTCYEGINFFYQGKPFLRKSLLSEYNSLFPGNLYSENDVQSTYSALGRLRILKYSNIRFDEVSRDSTEIDTSEVDAYIMLSRLKNKSLAFEIEGTNSAGDLGAAASVTFQHRNLFKGSEAFMFKVRGAYEAITGLGEGYLSDNYTEYGVESSLNFPEFMFPFISKEYKRRSRATSEVSLKYNWQIRPEFERTIASAAWSYRWMGKTRSSHRFDVLDINYIYMPWMSEEFRDYLNSMTDRNSILRYSYENMLIVKLGYTYTYNSAGGPVAQRTPKRDAYSIRFNIEESGNLLYLGSKLFHPHPKAGEAYQLANIDFAQYVKMDFDYSKNFIIDERNAFVFHVGAGLAVPYGNSKILPFEKRYFSGGANSVRGWSVRSLGPGEYNGYKSNGELDNMSYITRTGDIKLDVNFEYRTYLFWKLNGAAFIDAGNTWTLRASDDIPGGEFKFNRFYKQLAVAYGLGIRFDLDHLILRFDAGMKAVNPMKGEERFPLIKPDFSRDFAFHFAVGYPF